MPVSAVQVAKRTFISILLKIARRYNVQIGVNRDSADEAVKAAYKRVALKAHPDKGGSKEHLQELNKARDDWNDAKKAQQAETAQRQRQQQQQQAADGSQNLATARPDFRVNSSAVLLTYNGIRDTRHWEEFVEFVQGKLKEWGVRRWCATLEETRKQKLHTHLMLQFYKKVDCGHRYFSFGPIPPNAGPNGLGRDLCGQGIDTKRYQQSVDRGMFYVFAAKKGTCRDMDGNPVWAGNYAPAWIGEALGTYAVNPQWAQTLYQQYKLPGDVYEEYLFRCRGNIWAMKRTLDDCRAWEQQQEEKAEIAKVTKRIKSNPNVYRPFLTIPSAIEWLQRFAVDALRYPLLIVLAPSGIGKTEWVKSLFINPLELKIGALTHFPDDMRTFDRHVHDGIVCDDCRDLKFLADHQDKLQGKYDSRLEFATTVGGTCAYKKYLFAIPIAVTINYSTANLGFLATHDWLGKDINRVVINYDSSFISPPASCHGAGGA